MAKRIVNKAERNAERYDAKETGYQLYEGSLKGNKFDRLMPLIVSEQNIILAYRNICKNNGSKTPGTDGKTITEICYEIYDGKCTALSDFGDGR